MAAPTLGIFEYQYQDTGTTLNGALSGGTLYDVESVVGLDMDIIDFTEHDVDGKHGGVVSARFLKTRTVVIKGTLYATPTTLSNAVDSLTANYKPQDIDYPFYFNNGSGTRFVYAKPVSLKVDVARVWSTGSAPFQITLKAGDPIKYIETTTTNTIPSGSTGRSLTFNNLGNTHTYPIVRIQSGVYPGINIANTTTGRTLTFTRYAAASDIVDIDFNTKTLYVNGVRMSSVLGSSLVDWWPIAPGSNTIKFTGTANISTAPTFIITHRSGWL